MARGCVFMWMGRHKNRTLGDQVGMSWKNHQCFASFISPLFCPQVSYCFYLLELGRAHYCREWTLVPPFTNTNPSVWMYWLLGRENPVEESGSLAKAEPRPWLTHCRGDISGPGWFLITCLFVISVWVLNVYTWLILKALGWYCITRIEAIEMMSFILSSDWSCFCWRVLTSHSDPQGN